MTDRRAFLAYAGAAALTLAAGAPIGAAADFDPADVIAELRAAGLAIYWSRWLWPESRPLALSIVPVDGEDFTATQVDLMARWADTLAACPIRAARMDAFLAQFTGGAGHG